MLLLHSKYCFGVLYLFLIDNFVCFFTTAVGIYTSITPQIQIFVLCAELDIGTLIGNCVFHFTSVPKTANPSSTDLPAKSASNKDKGPTKKLKGLDGISVSVDDENAENKSGADAGRLDLFTFVLLLIDYVLSADLFFFFFLWVQIVQWVQ